MFDPRTHIDLLVALDLDSLCLVILSDRFRTEQSSFFGRVPVELDGVVNGLETGENEDSESF